MAILSNGKFYGFLCSAKETGQKLANGAKEYVEDFISGFAGHGWKIWEYVKGKWMLEIDSIRVRGQFTVFEMLVSKIRAIIGSQAITQGHAKIKNVAVADCEVHREIKTERYVEDFTGQKWERLAADNLIITPRTITVNGSSKYSPVLAIESATDAINPFKFTVAGLKESIQLTWTDEEGVMQTMEITEDGEYEYPKSYQLVDSPLETQRVGITINNAEDSLVIKQKVSFIEYSDFVTTELCYNLEIEDEINTISEYDFIKCQKLEKIYHVQVGSISEKYINIPISEFDVDDEGNITNPPEVGDEIVQFGNSSHLEAYIGRHSAIYMHADEGLQPAIDVLDGIYSKDWSDCLKVRMGGDIPGTTLKGFYSVNGIIKGVDESGHTVYCLYPDGTAELGDSSALFRPDKSGYIAGGSIAWEWNEEKKKYVVSMDDVQVEWTNLKDSLGWINEWTEKGTTIGDKFVAAPTGFFGKQDEDTKKLTGILMGEKVMVSGVERTGIFALVDDKPVFELDPVTKKYKFDGEIYSTRGVIGGFDLDKNGIKNTDGKRAIIDVHVTNYATDRRAALGNTLSSIVGFDVSAYMSATGNQDSENRALMLRSSGSTMQHGIWGGNCNFCIDAIGGVNWKMNKGDCWCMPGVLGYVYLETWYNNGKPILNSNYWGDGVRLYSIGIEQASANDGHNFVILKYYSKHDRVYCLPQNMGYDWNGTGKFELIPVVESTFDTVDAATNLRQMRITFWWRGGGKYIPNKSLYVLIGEPSD